MASFVYLQDIYCCDRCKSAADIYGRNCAHGMLFPLLLLMANSTTCPNFEFDPIKAEEQLRRKEGRGD